MSDDAKQTDCHDWFAEVAESYVRYIFSRAGFEVFGQSEWGADLAVRDPITKMWARCEVRSSDCKEEPRRKRSERMRLIAELSASVTLAKDGKTLRTQVYKLNKSGNRVQPTLGAQPISIIYESPSLLQAWLRSHVFLMTAEPELTPTSS